MKQYFRRQGGASGRAAVLPHGRFLRTVLHDDAQGGAKLLDITLTQRGSSGWPADPDGRRAPPRLRGLPGWRLVALASRYDEQIATRHWPWSGRTQGSAVVTPHGHRRRGSARRTPRIVAAGDQLLKHRRYGLARRISPAAACGERSRQRDDALEAELVCPQPAPTPDRRRRPRRRWKGSGAAAHRGCLMPTPAAASCCSSSAYLTACSASTTSHWPPPPPAPLPGYVEETQKQRRLPHLTSISVETSDGGGDERGPPAATSN